MVKNTVSVSEHSRSARSINQILVACAIGLSPVGVAQAADAKAPDPVRIAAFTSKKCQQEIDMMSAMDGKSASEKEVFCGCVGKRRTEYLMEKPEWSKKSHWLQKTYSRAIVTCSGEAKALSAAK